MKALRLPIAYPWSLIGSLPIPTACLLLRARRSAPGRAEVLSQARGSWSAGAPNPSGSSLRGREWDLSGLQAIHPVLLLRSRTPVEPTCPRHLTVTSMLPPLSGRRRLRRWLISGLTRELRHLLSYASRYRCRHVQSSLPADWLVFAGRESNPLDRCERFQLVLTIILPSCSPDATGFRFAPSGLQVLLVQ